MYGNYRKHKITRTKVEPAKHKIPWTSHQKIT
jgi:hypothetical protein